MKSDEPHTDGKEPPPSAGREQIGRGSVLLILMLVAQLLAILVFVARRIVNDRMGVEDALAAPTELLFLVLHPLIVHPISLRDWRVAIGGLAVMAACLFAGSVLGLALLESGLFGDIQGVWRLTVQFLCQLGIWSPGFFLFVDVTRRGGICASKIQR